jgi:hypothetical protein
MRSASNIPGRLLSLRASLVLVSSLFGLSLVPQPAQANMVRQIVVGKCSNAMQADFSKAGKTPPAGMVSETCGCVADEMLQRGQSLDQSKATCVRMATQKFGAF